MREIYWESNGGGFYLLTEASEGFVFVGHVRHRALLDDAALNGRVIVFDEASGQPVAIDQPVEVLENVE